MSSGFRAVDLLRELAYDCGVVVRAQFFRLLSGLVFNWDGVNSCVWDGIDGFFAVVDAGFGSPAVSGAAVLVEDDGSWSA